jgi:hypothetical protein
MPGFWKFWTDAGSKPPPEQAQAWQSFYVQPNAAVFRDLDVPCARHFNTASLETDYFPMVPQLASGMRELEASLPLTISQTRRQFQQNFPDMAWRGDIYLMASAGCFNGRSQKVDGSEALLLGLDNISYGLKETNLPALLEHELFHRYHHLYFEFEPQRDEPMWVRLWAEGMATYAARKLSPTATNMATMWMTDKKLADLDANQAQLAAAFLSRFDSTDQADADRYFLDDVSSDPNIPGHTGYYLGLRVAELLSQRYTMTVMAHWNRAQAMPQIRDALQHMANSRP